jgi:glucose-6-phosphate dehydrogenase assembly protein OpcA
VPDCPSPRHLSRVLRRNIVDSLTLPEPERRNDPTGTLAEGAAGANDAAVTKSLHLELWQTLTAESYKGATGASSRNLHIIAKVMPTPCRAAATE